MHKNPIKAVKGEMKRIDHPSKEKIIKDTGFVLLAAVITSTVIGGLDLGVGSIVSLVIQHL